MHIPSKPCILSHPSETIKFFVSEHLLIFIHSFNIYLLNLHHMLSTLIATEDLAMETRVIISTLKEYLQSTGDERS